MMEFSQPPPGPGAPVNYSMPPPQMSGGPPGGSPMPHQHHGGGHHHGGGGHQKHYHNYSRGGSNSHFRSFQNFGRGPGAMPMTQDDFDGKRLRKSVMRKTVDYNSAIVRALETRMWQRDYRDRRALQPESIYAFEMLPPPSYMDNPINAVTTRFVKTATNKMRCPIFTLAWTPEGRRLVTGASSGEFTLWNGLTFNFETILQAHDVPVRTMVWSHNDNWMITGDHAGYVKYWQSNMNNVRMFQAHKEPVRGISFSPSDNKFATCSDDGTLRVWDFLRCQEERVLRGHGADVKCVHWHPQKALIVSGSKDNQQPIKLWDPKSGQALATLHAHKSTVMDLKWNDNGNWLVTASRDHLLKLFDLRNLREEVQVFRGHKKEASAVAWHPQHEGLFTSGGSDGSILFWNVGSDKEVGAIEAAHDSIVWTLAWHPLGHILCSGSNDHTIKFWTRNRPGDQMRDKYNLNTLPAGLQGLEECEIDEHNITIPGMGPEDKIDFTESLTADRAFIPGLDLDTSNLPDNKNAKDKKVPYSKPIPRNFQAQWNDTGNRGDDEDLASKEIKDVITQITENKLGTTSAQQIPTHIVVYNRKIDVIPGSRLEKAIAEGSEALNRFITAGEVDQLSDIIKRADEQASDEEPSTKKSRFDKAVNHNAQIIYKDGGNNATSGTGTSNISNVNANTNPNINLNNTNTNQNQSNQSQPPSFIPSLMAINVDPDMSNNDSNNYGLPPRMDMGWAPGPPPPPGDNWVAAPPPMFAGGPMGPSGQPPSLLNLNVGPPFGDMPPNNWPVPPGNMANMPPNWPGPPGGMPNMSGGSNRQQSDGDTPKRRNRDSEGNRISRFDREGGGERAPRFENNENNNRRRSGGSSGGSGNNNWTQNNKRR